MLKNLFGAVVIAVLVIVGLPFLLKFFGIHAAPGAAKGGILSAILKWCSLAFAALGAAFLGGSYLAFMQGIFFQIRILAMVGVICLAAAVILWVVRAIKFKA